MASIEAAALVVLLVMGRCSSFQSPLASGARSRGRFLSSPGVFASLVSQESPPGTSLDSEAIRLKEELIALASATRRGFSASRSDRNKAKQIINDLASNNPSDEPVAAYYEGGDNSAGGARPSLAGKWTLIYTDAPDITGLEGGPFSSAKLGRIGQECNPPSIKNVIEWQRPDWASSLPFSGGESSRVLQKVCCEGTATKEKPSTVDLKIAGLELSGVNDGEDAGEGAFFNGPASFLESNPVKLQGLLTAPFGKFEILYLDDGMRITKTIQGFYAVNIRESKEDEWF